MRLTMRHRAAGLLLVVLFTLTALGQVTTRTVTGTIRKPDGSAWVGAKVTFELTKNTYTSTASFPATTVTATTNSSGQICVSPCSSPGVTLWTNAEGLAPAQYKVTYPDGAYFYGNLSAGATLDLGTWRASSSTPATVSNQTVLQSIVDAHAAASDPHPVYLTQPEGDARYAALGSGVTDHGALTGLSDDDHPQYLNTTRGDLRYYTQAQLYTKTEADALLAAKAAASDLTAEASARAAADTTLQSNVTAEASSRASADTTLQANIDAEAAARASAITAASTTDRARSNHTGTQTLSTISDAGTAAALNAPASGNAAAGEAVKGSDTRLTNARTPTAHASTHASAGSDPVTLAQSQVTNLTADLAGKQAALGFTPLNPANSLSDVGSASTARTNLGLGTLATQNGTFSGTSSGTNTGDQSSIVGITGTLAQFNTAVTDADLARTDAAQTFTGAQTFSGQVLTSAGSSAAPSVAASADTNTGVNLPGSDFLYLVAGGTPRLVVGAGQFILGSNDPVTWRNGVDASSGSQDNGIGRAKASVTELTDGGSTNGGTLRAKSATQTQLTTDTNNYAPTTLSLVQRWSSDASRTVTGLSISQVDGEFHYVWNVGSQNIVLANESTSSTAANRFTTTTGADVTLAPNKCTLVVYDGTSLRWRVALLP